MWLLWYFKQFIYGLASCFTNPDFLSLGRRPFRVKREEGVGKGNSFLPRVDEFGETHFPYAGCEVFVSHGNFRDDEDLIMVPGAEYTEEQLAWKCPVDYECRFIPKDEGLDIEIYPCLLIDQHAKMIKPIGGRNRAV